jgi:diguanylate cyclase (GGDEF)-like protein
MSTVTQARSLRKVRGQSGRPASRPQMTFGEVNLLALLLLVVIAAVFVQIRAPEQRTVFSDVVGPAVDLLATVSLLLAAWRARARSRRLGLGWGVIGVAMLLYALGDLTWSTLELVLKEQPFPSIADGFYLAYYPFFMAGVVLLTNKSARKVEQAYKGLDIATILAAAVLGFWNFLLGPILESNASAPLLEQIILLAYPVGDLVLLGGLLFLIYSDSDEHDLRWINVLATGIILTIVADALYSYRSLQGTYVSGDFLDLGWIAGNLIIGVAGASQWVAVGPATQPAAARRWSVFQGWLKSASPYGPYLWLLAAFVLLIVRALMPLPMSFLSIALGVGLIMILVLVRQLITLLDNKRLNLELKSQAARLERAIGDLHGEIAERRRMAEKLSYDTLHDGLTGLANRVLFLDRLGQAMKRSVRHRRQSLAVLFLDVDHFKVVNDSLGHIYGDQLLILIGRRLKETLRSIDTVARFGGDEFTILLEELTEKKSTRALTDRIQAAIRKPFVLNDHTVHVSVSIGVATNALKYDRPEDMVRDADLALYQAKARGKARSEVFALNMRDQAFWRLELEEELRRAIDRREFQLYYQPIRSLKTGRIVSLEALVRWMHPARGVVLPAEFLTVAEESGLILPLGDWVLNQACRQLKAWQQRHAGLSDVTVSVNISNREFSQPDLARKVAAALRSSHLKGSFLRLEITEQVMIGNRPTAGAVIAQLRNLGVQLQIDDFGIGYSALTYLQQFPIQAIKIDRSFVHRLKRDRRGLGLVRAMVSMARELGMDAIAEGIETGEQLKELKSLSCGFGQGYFLCEPLNAASLEKLFVKPQRTLKRRER